MPIFNSAKNKLLSANINLGSDTLKVMLLTSSFTPNIDTQVFISDISANEVSGTGYSAGGATLTSQTVVTDTTNDRAYLDADDTTWPSSTITARYAAVYKSTGTPSTSPVIGYIDFGSNKPTSGDTFYIQWTAPASGGILYLS